MQMQRESEGQCWKSVFFGGTQSYSRMKLESGVQFVFLLLPHGQKSEEPSDQGSSMSSWKAVSAIHAEVMSAGENGSKSHNGGDQRNRQKPLSRGITCKTHNHHNNKNSRTVSCES